MSTESGAAANGGQPELVESMAQILQDQRRINILMTRMVHDQNERVKALEEGMIAGGESGGQRASGKVAGATAIEIGKDIPAYPISDLEFLKKSEVFGTLDDDSLRVMYHKGELHKYKRGESIFGLGSKSDALYVIKEGVVEIARPMDDPNEFKTVAYFTKYDTIGEMRIITQSVHRSIARVPGLAEVFTLPYEAFIELMGLIPKLAVLMLEIFAHKLEGTVSTLRTHEQRQRQLEGNLDYFDLPTVIQTLLSTDQRTGILHVNDDKQQTVAELFIDGGTVKRARMGKLSGEDAFYQLFQAKLDRGSFFFKEDVEVDKETAEMEIPGMGLLMEAARLQDELSALKDEIDDPAKVYELKAEGLEWEVDEETGEEGKILAQAIWDGFGKGKTVQDLVDDLPRNTYAVYSTIATLMQTEQLG